MKSPVIYVARDIERALGVEPSQEYLVLTNDGPYARKAKDRYADFISLVPSEEPLDTFELIDGKEAAAFVSDIEKKTGQKPSIMVFKNTAQIDRICQGKSWDLLNPPASLAEKIENKVSQVEWLGSLSSFLPSFTLSPLKEIKWQKRPLVIQYAHTHTGEGTILIESPKELKALQDKFPDRPAKASEFVRGPVFTCNIVVESGKAQEESKKQKAKSKDETELRWRASAGDSTSAETQGGKRFLASEASKNAFAAVPRRGTEGSIYPYFGNVSYQITGMSPFTDSPFATVGNDWSLPHTLLTETKLEEFRDIAGKVAERMQESGWNGLFGIDVIYDEERDELRLLEINARQPASAGFESQLQTKLREHGIKGSTIFEAHLAALQGDTLAEPQIEINDGAQVVQRVTSRRSDLRNIAELEKAGYMCIPYQNSKPNADLLRIQSDKGIMEKHGKLNKRGEEIVKILEK